MVLKPAKAARAMHMTLRLTESLLISVRLKSSGCYALPVRR